VQVDRPRACGGNVHLAPKAHLFLASVRAGLALKGLLDPLTMPRCGAVARLHFGRFLLRPDAIADPVP